MNEDIQLSPLRQELNYKIVDENGDRLIVLSDPLGIAMQSAALPLDIIPLLQLMNDSLKKSEVEEILKEQIHEEADFIIKTFFELYQNLDYLGFLDSPRFHIIKNDFENYMVSDVRNPICAGNSYSADPEVLTKELNDILNVYKDETSDGKSSSIIVPHIDFQIGEEAHRAYSSGYNAIRNSDADVFIILGTSHYGNSSTFMLTKKDFNTPLGRAETDKTILSSLRNKLSFNLTYDDKAHRYEHSIELQVVLLQQLFKERDFTILPILVGSLGSHIINNSLPAYDARFTEFVDVLSQVLDESGKKAVYIASVDFAHIGRKFGDDFDAEGKLVDLKAEDLKLIDYIKNGDGDSFFSEISRIKDKNKICGLSPIYTLLNLFPSNKFEFLSYGQWNETETGSAVSFASLAGKSE